MKRSIENLAEMLVLTEPRDLPGLAALHSGFEALQAEARDADLAWVASVAEASAQVIQAVILDEVEDRDAALEAVAGAVTAIQQRVIEGRGQQELALDPMIAGAVAEADDTSAEGPSPGPASPKHASNQAPVSGPTAPGGADDEPPHAHETGARGSEPAEAEGSADPADGGSGPHQARASGDPAAAGGGSAEDAEPPAEPAASPAPEPQPLTGDPELTGEFIAEANEHLDNADGYLLTIESNPDDQDAINALFRAFHTIKGVSGFLDLADIQHLAHQTENLLDAARQGEFRLEGPRLDVVFDATDVMKQLIADVAEALASGGNLPRHPRQQELIGRLDALMRRAPAPSQEAEADGSAAPEPADPSNDQATKQADDQADDQTDDQTAATSAAAANDAAAKESEPATPTRAGVTLRETVKVDSYRLDAMIDAIGELVIAEAMVTQSPELRRVGDDGIETRLNHLSKITRELQEMATSLRLVPIRATFQRMARLARDTAKKLGKRIDFVTSGEEVELDKTVVDLIGDPLVHMIRNAVDHGIEDDTAGRAEAGKPETGRVELRAFHRGGSIYIEIADDGAGLDRDRILAKAVERGLVKGDEKLADNEVYQLIMEPGFSTAKALSDVSGRGVGMDVVKKNIQKMRGQVEISSTPGEGTTFSVRLPLTLAIIDGMVVRVGAQRYVLPLLSIMRMLRPEDHHVPTVFGQSQMLQQDDGLIPLYRIHDLFEIPDAQTDPRQASVVVVEHEGKSYGLMIDELIGQQQIVIKSLGKSLRGVPGIAGGAIMPDGKVGLILDLDGLIRLAGGAAAERAAA